LHAFHEDRDGMAAFKMGITYSCYIEVTIERQPLGLGFGEREG